MIASVVDQEDQWFLLILAPTCGCEKNSNDGRPRVGISWDYSVSDSITGEISPLHSLTGPRRSVAAGTARHYAFSLSDFTLPAITACPPWDT